MASRDDSNVLIGFVACLQYGFAAVVVNPELPSPELHYAAILTRPAASIVGEHLDSPWLRDQVHHVMRFPEEGPRKGGLLSKLLGKSSATGEAEASLWDTLREVSPVPPPDGLSDDREAYVLMTSGSTSKPKGVPISRAGLLLHARTLSLQYGYGPGSRLFCTLPLFHTDGLIHGLVVAWMNAAQALRPARFSLSEAGELLDSLYALRATHFITVPTQLLILERFSEGREDTFRSEEFRCVVSSAAPLETSLWARFQNRFRVRVANCYGLTETVCGGLFCGPGDETFRMGTVGKPLDCQVRIVDDSGSDLKPLEVGELLMGGAHITPGYLTAEEAADRSTFVDGWFRTGDLAVCDHDGFYRIVGRKKNIIISGGINLQPEEVSAALCTLSGVQEAVAFGIEDEVFGEILVACVSPADGIRPTEAKLLAQCRTVLAAEKVPKAIAILPAIPHGATGKVDVERSKTFFLSARSRHPLGASADLEHEVLAMAAEVFKAPLTEIRPSFAAADIPGWDSFGHLAFMVELEARFGIQLAPAEILSVRTLADAQRLVRAKTSS